MERLGLVAEVAVLVTVDLTMGLIEAHPAPLSPRKPSVKGD